MSIRSGSIFIGLVVLLAGAAPAGAAKGDLHIQVRRSSPLLERRVLDLRFAGFAQGIWTRHSSDCQSLRNIDQAQPGTAVVIFRGLFETPTEICHVYGAEQRASGSQRAAMNCQLVSGGESLGLVTVRPIGSVGLSVQDGERPPIHYRFCRSIKPVIQPVGQ